MIFAKRSGGFEYEMGVTGATGSIKMGPTANEDRGKSGEGTEQAARAMVGLEFFFFFYTQCAHAHCLARPQCLPKQWIIKNEEKTENFEIRFFKRTRFIRIFASPPKQNELFH